MKTVLFIYIFLSQIANAALPQYNSPEILARANITDGFNLAPMSFINNASPVINDKGDIAFKVAALAGENIQALWVNGKIQYIAPDARLITDPAINSQGEIVFNLYDDGVTDGLFILDSKSEKVTQVLPATNLHLQSFTYAQIIDNHNIYFRGTDDNQNRSFFTFNNKLSTIFSEGNNTSYIFKPSVNNRGAAVFKIRLGERGQWDENAPDQLILIEDNVKEVIAVDKDTDSSSAFLGFNNSLSISDNGLVAFIGIIDKNQRGIFLYDDGKIINLALEGKKNIAEIENLSVKVNDDGMVLFRAKDAEGKRALFVADINEVKRIIGEGDQLESDLGKSKILLNQLFPGFGGEMDMNSDGDIVFNCMLVQASDDKEQGQAIYKITAKK